MNKKLIIALTIVMFAIWAVNIYFYFKPKDVEVYMPVATTTTSTTTTIPEQVVINISTECISDSECSWQSTNCCPEEAGANWECINYGNSIIKCTENILCPQFVSPKPEASCVCLDGECTA